MSLSATTPRPAWANALDRLLAPLPGSSPSGPWLRYDPQVALIKQAREADDPSLPMGDWERPLRQADWQEVESLCLQFLENRSKDLQIACWLLEAAVHRYEIPGLHAGIDLLHGLLEQHWETLHPLIEDGDADARIASLAWLNETLPRKLRLLITLLPLPGRRPPRLIQEDWEQQGKQAAAAGDNTPTKEDPEGLPSRSTLLKMVGEPAGLAHVHRLREELQLTAESWEQLDRLVTDKLGRDAPSLNKVSEALEQLIHSCTQLMAGRSWHDDTSTATAVTEPQQPTAQSDQNGTAVPGFTLNISGASTTSMENSLHSRDAAYQALEQIADYLQTVEPHSPTPYLIRRAVKWGKMPLPELMQEVLREEGDLNRLFTVLGLVPGGE